VNRAVHQGTRRAHKSHGCWKYAHWFVEKFQGTAHSTEIVDLIMGFADDQAPGGRLMRWLMATFALIFLVCTIDACAGAEIRASSASVTDVVVRDQNDRKLHFYSDLVKDHIVAVNFIFTGCSTVCPIMGASFAHLQKLLGKSAGEVNLVSVSLDPLNDIPARLSEWSSKFGAKPGWTLVTGGKSEIDALLLSLGASAADPGSHAPLIVIIDDLHGGPWQRLDGLTDPAVLAQILRSRIKYP